MQPLKATAQSWAPPNRQAEHQLGLFTTNSKSTVPRSMKSKSQAPARKPSSWEERGDPSEPAFQGDIQRLEDNVARYHYLHQNEVITSLANTDKNTSDIASLQGNVRDIAQIFGPQFQALEGEVRQLRAEQAAIKQEHEDMKSFFQARALADAHGQELHARRLEDGGVPIEQDQPSKTNGGMLEWTSADAKSEVAVQEASEMPVAQEVRKKPVRARDPVPLSLINTEDSPESESDNASEKTVWYDQSPLARQSVPDNNNVPQDDTPSKDNAVAASEANWRPQAIADLKPFVMATPPTSQKTFTWEEIHIHLGGGHYSPGLYFTTRGGTILPNKARTYWLLEGVCEPFAPQAPGQHGAKITAFFNDTASESGDNTPNEDDYTNIPVFVSEEPGHYTYMGQYSQPRYSDRLSHSEQLQRVPARVLEYWAEQLASPDRPEWVTKQLIEHFWPRPTYQGPIPGDSQPTSPDTAAAGDASSRDAATGLEKGVMRAFQNFAEELREWEKDARFKGSLITEKVLMDAWTKSDMDVEPGLRLWWEYLECVDFDHAFQERLVAACEKAKQVDSQNRARKNAGPAIEEEKQQNDTTSKSDTARDSISPLNLADDSSQKAKAFNIRKPAVRIVSRPVELVKGDANFDPSTITNGWQGTPFSDDAVEAYRKIHKPTKAEEPERKVNGKPVPRQRPIKW